MERTQHLDRIPLTRDGGGVWPPRIEIMVPVPEPFTDGHDLQSIRSWVAFRRAVHVPVYRTEEFNRDLGAGRVMAVVAGGGTPAAGDDGNGGGGNAGGGDGDAADADGNPAM